MSRRKSRRHRLRLVRLVFLLGDLRVCQVVNLRAVLRRIRAGSQLQRRAVSRVGSLLVFLVEFLPVSQQRTSRRGNLPLCLVASLLLSLVVNPPVNRLKIRHSLLQCLLRSHRFLQTCLVQIRLVNLRPNLRPSLPLCQLRSLLSLLENRHHSLLHSLVYNRHQSQLRLPVLLVSFQRDNPQAHPPRSRKVTTQSSSRTRQQICLQPRDRGRLRRWRQ